MVGPPAPVEVMVVGGPELPPDEPLAASAEGNRKAVPSNQTGYIRPLTISVPVAAVTPSVLRTGVAPSKLIFRVVAPVVPLAEGVQLTTMPWVYVVNAGLNAQL